MNDKVWICRDGDRAQTRWSVPSYCYYGGQHRFGCGWYVKMSDIDADGEGKARRDHPDTAKAAAKTIGRVGSKRRDVYEIIKAGHPEGDGMTDEEIAYALRLNPNTVRPRRVELVEGGWVRDSGRCRKTAAGRDAIVWEATP